MNGWRFLVVPKVESATVREKWGNQAKGWGSLPVVVELGDAKWKTSIFPDKKSGGYLLPLKAAVRKAEGVGDRDTVEFSITL